MARSWAVVVLALLSASRALAQAPAATAAFPSTAPSAPPEAAPPTGGPPEGAPPGVVSPPSSAMPQPAPASSVSPPPGSYAQPAPAGPPPGTYYTPPPELPPKKVRYVSLTFSPLHLIAPIFEVMVEARLAGHVGLAVIGGLGSYSVTRPATFTQAAYDDSFGVQELGGQLALYPLEDFDSLTLGAEVLYIHLAGDLPEVSSTAFGTGIAVGPFVGYKLITSGGFTFLVQGGVEYASVSATATTTTDQTTASASKSKVIPLLNLNLGWSF